MDVGIEGLVQHPLGSVAVEGPQPFEMLLGDPADGRRVQGCHARQWVVMAAEHAGDGVKRTADGEHLAGAVGLWVARQDLLDQGRPGPWKAKDKNGPARGMTGPG